MSRDVRPSGSSRLVLAILLSLVVIVFGCSQRAPAPSKPSAPAPPPKGSVTAGPLALSVELPAAQLAASSIQTATVTVVNSSETATQIVTPVLQLLIVDSTGKTAFDSMPARQSLGFPGFTRLAPREAWTRPLAFEVPPPGSYSLEVEDRASPPFAGPASVRFESVR